MEQNDKTQIVFQPIKRTVIFQLMELTNAEFFKRLGMLVGSEQAIVLNWAEGVLFLGLPYEPSNEIIVDEALKGTRYLDIVIFTSMLKYESFKKIGAREIPIVDQTSDSYLRQIAEWLKKRASP